MRSKKQQSWKLKYSFQELIESDTLQTFHDQGKCEKRNEMNVVPVQGNYTGC